MGFLKSLKTWKNTAAFQAAEVYQFVGLRAPALPFQDQSFDAVFLMHVIEHVKNPYELLAEMMQDFKQNFIILYPKSMRRKCMKEKNG
ncbi:methyltransferase domain-containing protein [Candidatus Daviesbacteria bacterium]|nr:methyltransferase domain-containing protein [Candidatus Daviesbacteria bacterium]